jgi:hypothetical protein
MLKQLGYGAGSRQLVPPGQAGYSNGSGIMKTPLFLVILGDL